VTTICESCPSRQQCFGDGPETTPLVIVGEAPGRQEVVAGRPFVGPSGKLLDSILREFGVPRDAVYMTNVVMCRPTGPDGRDIAPSRQAVHACHNRLVSDIRDRSPKIVLAVGATAAQTLLGTEQKISEIAGAMQWNEDIGSFVIPTYHPAAVLHGSSGFFDAIYEATKRAVRIAQGRQALPPKVVELDWKLCRSTAESIEALEQLLDSNPSVIAFDTESKTSSKIGPRAKEDEWVMGQFYVGPGTQAFAINMRTMQFNEKFMKRHDQLLNVPGIEWRMHNKAYDLQVLSANGLTRPANVTCTMALMIGLTERGEETGLKAASRTYDNAAYYETGLYDAGYHWMTGPRNWTQWEALAKYGCLDVYHTYNLGEILPPLLEEERTMELNTNLLQPAASTFADWSYDGAKVDLPYANELEREWLPIIEAAEAKMQVYARDCGFPTDPVEAGMTGQKKAQLCEVCIPLMDLSNIMTLQSLSRTEWRTWCRDNGGGDPSCAKCMKRRFVLVSDDTLNVRSYKQLQHLAFDILGMHHPEYNKRSTEEVFLAYNENHQFVQHLRAIRELDHLLRNYVRGISDDVWSDDRVHPDFLLYGTVTGRLSIHNPPLQTLPKWGVDPKNAKLIRRLFVPDDDECFIAEADYKNLELFIAWHYSGDDNLGRALTVQDFHTATASAIFNKPYDEVTGADRFQSKFVTFGITYGRGSWSLAQGELKELTGGDEREAQRYIDRFWGLYPDYKRVYDQWIYDAIHKGELRTPMGRVRRWRLIDKSKLNHIKNQAVNSPIQALASDTCLSAGIRLSRMLKERGWGRVLFPVHDSLVFNLKKAHKTEALRLIRTVMTTPPYETHIKLFVDIECGPSLGEVEKWEDPIDFAV
jgi:uracil-DNA glycosylase family 4